MTSGATVLLVGLVANVAWAQDRPAEDVLFGPAPDAGTPGTASPGVPGPSLPTGTGALPDRSSATG